MRKPPLSRLRPRPVPTFHPFRRLPVELRLKIWGLTVESRVVGVYALRRHTREHHSSRTLLRTNREIHTALTRRAHGASKAPLSEICRESRAIALDLGSFTMLDDMSLDDSRPAPRQRRFATSNDPMPTQMARPIHINDAANEKTIRRGWFEGSKLGTVHATTDILYLHFEHPFFLESYRRELTRGTLQKFTKEIHSNILHKIRHLAFDSRYLEFKAISPGANISRDWEHLIEMKGLERVTFVYYPVTPTQMASTFRESIQPVLSGHKQRILECFEALSARNPDWKVPKVEVVFLKSDLEELLV